MDAQRLKVLVLSFYYPPDLSAGSFRATALVGALIDLLPPSGRVDVLTTLPNRYHSFSSDALELEAHGALQIRRIRLPRHSSGMADQSRAFIRFAIEVMRFVRSRRYDLIYATSSRLMTASLAAWIARRQKAKLYLDIRDIFVDTITEVLPAAPGLLMKPLLSALERWTIARADKVNLVSAGFKSYFEARYPHVRYSFFTNGVDPEFLRAAAGTQAQTRAVRPLTVLYAGNIGEGQGLHLIVPVLAQRMRGRAVFKMIGDGGRRIALEKTLQEQSIDNVELLSPMPRERLIEAYKEADVLFLHLNDYQAFKKVLPSKIFEYAAMGKPIWAGLSGYAADFVRSEISNAAVFPPCDPDAGLAAFAQLSLHRVQRTEFLEKFSRTKLMRAMAIDVLSVAQAGV